mmetsp:Transcript_1798/g.2505  ORF Transcript_1798/g.2505 Transcript_1798/m.2505 type:complete len:270 (+) Transcript_1798:215-1024(+)
MDRTLHSSSMKLVEVNNDMLFTQNLEYDNNKALELLLHLASTDDGWTFVTIRNGVKVLKRFLRAGSFVNAKDSTKGEKHVCIKSFGEIDAPPDIVFQMFVDKRKVKEYNEHIVSMKDCKEFPKSTNIMTGVTTWTKFTWSSTPSYGPFKPRDFFSVVHFRKLPNGSYLILNRPAYHSSDNKIISTSKDKYLRATILLAGNIITPIGKNRSKLTMIAHVNPGGGGDTKTGAFFANKLCAAAPPTFIRKLEAAAMKSLSTSSSTTAIVPVS